MDSEIYMALILGLAGGIVPGPVLAASFTETLLHGFWKSMRIILWALLIETLVAVASLMILSAVHLPAWFFNVLSLVGAAMLLWIAFSVWKINSIETKSTMVFSFSKMLVMILANGVLWTYWITVCVPQAISLGEKIPGGNFLFVLLVEAGWLISTVAVVFLFSRFRRLLTGTRTIRWVARFLSLVFAYFAIDILYHSIQFLFFN